MKTLKIIKGPGYLYDLCMLFTFYFNQELFFSEQINKNKFVEDTEYFHRILNAIEKIPEELKVFFQVRENKKCFFTTFYFHNNIDQILSDSGIESLQDSLKDHDEVIRNVAKYYFGFDASSFSYNDPQFFRSVGKRIRDSHYDTDLKNCLYEFFLDPIPVIQTLSTELTRKEVLLSKLYNENDAAITKVQNKIDLDRLAEKTLSTKTKAIDISSYDETIVSICAVHKNCIGAFLSEKTALIILGFDYEDFSNYANTRGRTPELSQLGIALAEANRIQILEFIHEKGEVSVADIRSELNFSQTNAYYHITLLQKSNLLKFRNCGRTIFYSLNHAYFNDICTMLSKFKQEGGEKL